MPRAAKAGRAKASMEPLAPRVRSFRVEVVSSHAAFVALEREWNRLVQRSEVGDPFLTHEWARTWWECFGTGCRLHVLVARSDGAAVAILPLIARTRRLYGQKTRCLELMHNAHTPRCGPIAAGPGQEDAYRAFWDHLRARGSEWDVLLLAQVPDASPALGSFEDLARADGYLVGRWASCRSPYLSCGPDWDAYLRSLGTKHRSNLRNRLLRLAKLGPVRLEILSDTESVIPALEEGLRLEAAGWKGRTGTAVLSQPDTHVFYDLLARRTARRGWLELRFLSVTGRRIAFHYGLRYAGKVYLLKPGYDPEYSPYSPGTVLLFLALEDAFRRGATEFDFLGDDEHWKLEWTSSSRPHSWLYVLPSRPRTRLLHALKFRIAPRLAHYPLVRIARNALAHLAREEG